MTAITTLYIPNIEHFITAQYVRNVFYKNKLAIVQSVVIIPYINKYNLAVVQIDSWCESEAAYHFIQRLRNNNVETRLVYSDDNWWVVNTPLQQFLKQSKSKEKEEKKEEEKEYLEEEEEEEKEKEDLGDEKSELEEGEIEELEEGEDLEEEEGDPLNSFVRMNKQESDIIRTQVEEEKEKQQHYERTQEQFLQFLQRLQKIDEEQKEKEQQQHELTNMSLQDVDIVPINYGYDYIKWNDYSEAMWDKLFW